MKCKSAAGGILLLGVLAAGPAWAQETGFYLGGSIGRVEHQEGCEGVSIPCDQKDTSWKIFAGYRFNRHFAAELGYADLGETTASGVQNGVNVNAAAEVTAWELVAIGMAPVMERLSFYGKLGVYRGEVEIRATASVPGFSRSASQDESNTGATFGFGMKYDFTRSLAIRAEWQRYVDVGGDQTGESDVDVLGIGLLYRF